MGSKDIIEVLVIDSISHGGKTFREHCVSYHSCCCCVCVFFFFWGGGGGYIMYKCGDSWTATKVWWWCVEEEGMVMMMMCDDSWTATRVWCCVC